MKIKIKPKIINKIDILLILLIVFLPINCFAWIIVPSANLTITVESQDQEGLFNFKLQEYREVCEDVYNEQEDIYERNCYYSWQNIEEFSLQTENFQAQKQFLDITAFGSEQYKVIQELSDGFAIQNISCVSDDASNTFLYDSNFVKFYLNSSSNTNCIFSNKKSVSKTPVLFVPGILGTEMKKGEELLWADISKMILSPSDSFMKPLSFNSDLNPSDSLVSVYNVIKSKTGYDYSESLINEFAGQGYIENELFFTFPYDWRYGVSGKYASGITNVDLLKQKIDEIISLTGSPTINIIAHSNGGLLTKQYVMQNQQDHKINKAIFLGVPNTGSPKAIKALLFGDDFGVKLGPFGLNQNLMQEISQNMPVVYDLLPTQTYYNTSGSFVNVVERSRYTQIQNDLNYQDFGSYIIQDKIMNANAFSNSQQLHSQDYNDFDLRKTGINLYNIVGCKVSTMTNLKEIRQKDLNNNYTGIGYVIDNFKVGDGTVPISSATNLPVNKENKFYAINSDHGKMPSQDGIRQLMVNIITGNNLPVSEGLITQDINLCQLTGKIIEIFSPINIEVIDEFGNKITKEQDGFTTNQISGASIEILGEQKFLFIPTDNNQKYTINLYGTGSGNYTIKVKEVQNNQTTKIENFINLPVGPNLTGFINLGNQNNPTTLTTKQDSNSQEQVILPSSILQEQADDFFAPTSNINLVGELKDGFYTTDVEVQITAEDFIVEVKESKTSDILYISYVLNNQEQQIVYSNTTSFTLKENGNYKISYFAVDKNANIEPENSIEFNIKKPQIIDNPTDSSISYGTIENLAQNNNLQNQNQEMQTQNQGQENNLVDNLPTIEPSPEIVVKKEDIVAPKIVAKQIKQLTPKIIVEKQEDKEQEVVIQEKKQEPISSNKKSFLASMIETGRWLWNIVLDVFR